MKEWRKCSVATTEEAEDILAAALEERGITGIEITDHKPISEAEMKALFVDASLLPTLPPDDGTAVVSFYVEPERSEEEVRSLVRSAVEETASFLPAGSGEVTFDTTREEDWINNWKTYFEPFRVDDHLVIRPTWKACPDTRPDDIVICMDPGTAFGTGAHESTKLVLLAMKPYLKADTRLLDIGTGSGILSIYGLLSGIREAAATDVDPAAIAASRSNTRDNHVDDSRFRLYEGDILHDEVLAEKVGTGYDLITANILANVIIPLSASAAHFLKPGGIYITSGIINTMEDEVREAILQGGFRILSCDRMGDWVSFTAQNITS